MAVSIAINGAAGRMGRTLIDAVAQHPGAQLGAAIEHAQSPLVGADAGATAGIGANGVRIVASAATALADSDVMIDFSTPLATVENLSNCVAARRALVIGRRRTPSPARRPSSWSWPDRPSRPSRPLPRPAPWC